MQKFKLYGVKEVADMFGVSSQAIRNMIDREELKAVKIGGSYRIPQKEIDRLIEPIADIIEIVEMPVNDNLVTSTDAPPQPTESTTTGDKATLETDAQHPDDTTGEPSNRPEWDGISGKPIAPLPDSWKK